VVRSKGRLGGCQCRFGPLDLGVADFHRLGGDQILQHAVASGFALRLLQLCAALQHGGLRFVDGQLEARPIDHEQYLATRDTLVVAHPQFGDQPGHIRRDLDDIGMYMPITGPGRFHVVVPQVQADDGGDGYSQQGQQYRAGGGYPVLHDSNPRYEIEQGAEHDDVQGKIEQRRVPDPAVEADTLQQRGQ